ncbi:hypothetical protein SDC9_138819 [bioreactor metagenome]|uniref:Uncharacterized protein n=1 Tax=bioreactor metagenome TaxID=1076179 RepID=A0A645DQT5_9ZZZZ
MKRLRIAPDGGLLHHRPSGIAESEEFRRLVERFAGGVVDGKSEMPRAAVAPDGQQTGVAARHHQRQHRIARRIGQHGRPGSAEKRAVNMSEKMIDAVKRLAPGQCETLGEIDPHQQRRDQPRPLRHRDRVDLLQGDARLGERTVEHRLQRRQVFARRQFRNHAAVRRVLRDLRRDAAGQHFISVFDHSRGGFVAAGLYSQNQSHFEKIPIQLFAFGKYTVPLRQRQISRQKNRRKTGKLHASAGTL